MGILDRVHRDNVLLEAEGYLELGMPAHAVTAVTTLGPSVATDGQASYLLGEALRAQAKYDDALVPLERAIQLIVDDIHVYLALAWCYKRTDRLSLAIEALERAIEVDPSEALVHYNLACYWSLANNRSVSLRYLAQAFELDVGYRELVYEEPDFDNLRDDPEFQKMTDVIVQPE